MQYKISNETFITKINLEALLNFEINIIHKEKRRSVVQLRNESYEQKQS